MLANAVAAVASCCSAACSPSAWCSRAGRLCTGWRRRRSIRCSTAHGIDMLIYWIIFFEIAVLYFCVLDVVALPDSDAQSGVACLCADDHRRSDEQRRGLPGRLQRHDDVVRAHDGCAVLLPRAHPVRGGGADRLLRILSARWWSRNARGPMQGSVPLVTFGAITGVRSSRSSRSLRARSS